MNIDRITLLETSTHYIATWYGVAVLSIFVILLISFFLIFVELEKPWTLFAAIISVGCFIATIGLSTDSNNNNFLNQYDYTSYIIQVEDDNAWREIGPHYQVIKELYTNSNIYEVRSIEE